MNEARPRVLVVDDTPDNILLLTETLKDTYQVQAAINGTKAIQVASRVPAPDLILLDVMMPDMDGYEVFQALREIPTCASVPVIFVTALSGSGDEERGLAMGAVDYITKPFNPSLVRARVRNHIELKQHRDFLEQEVQRRTQELLQATMARQLLESDLKLALKLQRSMLKATRSKRKGSYEIAAELRPARAIGGDLYDYIRLDGNRLLFCVGDVSDKGVAAALFMVRVLTLLHGLAPTCSDPAQLLRDLNDALCQDNDACMFVTLGCGIVDLDLGRVLYAHGGHEPLVLVGEGGAQLLDLEGGPALGLYEADFPLHTLHLESECLVLVSDGVNEANNPARELFGTDRLVAAVAGDSPTAVLERCLQAVDAFADGAEPSDDLTVLIVQLQATGKRWHLKCQLPELARFSSELRRQLSGFSDDLIGDLDLVTEELIGNVINHGNLNRDTDYIEVAMDVENGVVRLVVRDQGRAFNPLEAEERPEDKVGGWGVPLIRTLTDRVEYARVGDWNQLSLWRGERESSPR